MTIVPRTGPLSASSALVEDVLVPAGEVLRLGGEHGSLGHRAAIVLPAATIGRSHFALSRVAPAIVAALAGPGGSSASTRTPERGVQVVAPAGVGDHRRRTAGGPVAVARHGVVGGQVDQVGGGPRIGQVLGVEAGRDQEPADDGAGIGDEVLVPAGGPLDRPAGRRAGHRGRSHDPTPASPAPPAGRRGGPPTGGAPDPAPARPRSALRRAPRSRDGDHPAADPGGGAPPRTAACRSTRTAPGRSGSSWRCRRGRGSRPGLRCSR